MAESVRLARRRWQVRVWALLLVPVACAPVFYFLAMRDRISPADRVELLWRWFKQPHKYPFSPMEGEPAVPGDMLVVIAEVSFNGSYHTGNIRRLMPDGTIDYTINRYIDEYGSQGRVRADNLARLPALLKALPPSDPAARPTNRVIVAFSDKGRWIVRSYRNDAVPKGVRDVEKVLHVPKYDGD